MAFLIFTREMNIGVFDSGFGGLTILKEIVSEMPEYNYTYLGDNARSPYGNRSFETVYEYTLQAVKKLFELDCVLVILACNTASAKALRTIQQVDLPQIAPLRRVLGVIRPSIEKVDEYSKSKHIGILGTAGTVKSESYVIELANQSPWLHVTQEACPMWVPLVENREYDSEGANYFVKKNIGNLFRKDKDIDTIILGCTHYPLLIDKIRNYIPERVVILNQGEVVAKSLRDYLARHQEIEQLCEKEGKQRFFTTESTGVFDELASVFFGNTIQSKKLSL